MFVSKSLVVALLATSGLFGSIPQATSANDAAQVVVSQDLDAQYGHHYYVYYRGHYGWKLAGCYDCPYRAREVATLLRYKGYDTKIVCKY